MMLRRFAFAPLLALATFACNAPSVPSQQTSTVVTAEFDLASSPPVIPLPNDLAIQPLLNPGIRPPQTSAQNELLGYFLAQGGFPPDQVFPLDFPLATLNVKGPNDVVATAPDIDPATLVPCTGPKTPANCNVFVLATLPTVAFPTFAVTYDIGAAGAQSGTLTVVPVSGTSPIPWKSDTVQVTHYIYALRGGASGIKTKTGEPLQPSTTSYTLLFGGANDFTCPSTNPSCPLPLLGQIQAGYEPVFAAIEGYGFPLAETVVVGSFPIAPATTWVQADAASGQVPFPSDFLLDPTTGRINAALDATAGGLPLSSLDGFSTTAMILAPTSGPIQANTVHDPALPQGVFLYEINAAGTGATKVPDLVDALTSAPGTVRPVFVAEPPQIQSSGFSQVIGLQPAVPVSSGGVNVMLPPLKENTEYAVIVTNRVKSAAGAPISKTTLGQIELFTNPLCTPSPACAASPGTAVSEIPGIPGSQASGLEAMRLGLQPVIAQLAADTGCNTTPAGSGCVARSQVAMAYTFRTQTISGRYATTAGGGKGGAGAIRISAIPYTPLLAGVCAALGPALGVTNLDCTKPLPGSLVTYTGTTAGSTVADAFTAWGIDTAVPHDKIDTVYVLKIATINKIDDATGAFNPSPTGAKPEVLTVLVAVGAQASMPACTGALEQFAAFGIRCAPLVVFQHGITTAKNYVLGVANTLVDKGNLVVGIDLPWHGERTFCSTTAVTGNPNAECVPGNFCVPEPAMAGQAIPPGQAPGKCRTGSSATSPLGAFANEAALCLGNGCSCVPSLGACFFPQNQGYPLASGEFFVSANFFRTRDGIRQAWIDQTQLLQVLAPTPVAGQMAGNDFYNALLAKGILVNPADVSFLGQSFGSIISTGSLAANPRFSRAVFNTNGGTAVDVFTNAPRYQAEVDALFLSLGIDRTILRNPPAPGSEGYAAYLAQASSYLTYINVLKLIMDPADPINAAGHLEADTWPNLLPPLGGNVDGSVAQSPKKTLAQYAICDQSVPNPFNALVAGNIGLTPVLPPLTTTPPPTGTVQWFGSLAVSYPAAPIYPDGCPLGAPHEFLLSWGAEFAAGTAGRASVAQLTAAAQLGAATFLADPIPLSPTLVVVP